MTDSIIKHFNRGSEKAYQKIFNKLYPVLCSFAEKYLNDSDEAEDVTQEVFIELWNQKEKFISINQIKNFLYLSIKNKCLNIIKHNKVRLNYINDYNIIEKEDYYEEQIIRSEINLYIKNAIFSLSKQKREIIILSMKGFKNNEIAEELNISINTVKLQKKLAYQKLREQLKSSVFSILL